MKTATRDLAMRYVDAGFSVIPCKPKSKLPAGRTWSQYQDACPDRSTVTRMFRDDSRNIGLVMGPVSGGLACRDFDQSDSYERWADDHPPLAKALPTAETQRGFHVYFRSEPTTDTVVRFDDGELRISRCYNLAPRSVHPAGKRYTWRVPLGNRIPCVDLVEAGFLQKPSDADFCYREHGGQQRTTESTEVILRGGDCCTAPLSEWPEAIELAILASLPTGPGRRNAQLFELARALKAVPTLADAPGTELRPFVKRWHELALPVIGTTEFEDSWVDFLRGWRRVRFPKGVEPMEKILDLAAARTTPAVALKFDADGLRLLVAICQELQRAAGDGPFFLACRTAARLLNVDHMRAWRYLWLLKEEEILRTVTVGSHATRRATRWKYLPPIEG